MHRYLLVAALVLIAAGLAAGENAASAPQIGVKATVAKTANVRFGPNTNAPKVPKELAAGTVIEVLGKAPGGGVNGGWYMIRFPKECFAWVHDKNLQKVEGAARWRVMQDKVRLRDDATLKGNIVAELNTGDEVDDRGQVIGNWVAVYPPTAVAYIAAMLVSLPKEAVTQVLEGNQRQRRADVLWKQVHGLYDQWRVAEFRQAMGLDWAGMAAQLAQVAEHHGSGAVRREALRLKDGVDNVVREQDKRGFKPSFPIPAPPADEPAPTVVVPPVAVAPRPPVSADPQPRPVTPPPPISDPRTPVAADPPPVPPTAAPDQQLATIIGPESKAPSRAAGVEGWLEQRDVPEVGASYVLIDENSKVVAYLKPKDASQQLSEYFWALVAVKGQAQALPAKPGIEANAPLIVIDDVQKVGR